MPELPEVETVRRGLEPIIGHMIVGCDVRRRDVVRDQTTNAANPRRGRIEPIPLGIGCNVIRLERLGKQMAVVVQDPDQRERMIVIQLGMSGQVSLIDTPRIPDAKHVHVVWTLGDGRRVCFRDPRRFGAVTLLRDRDQLDSFWAQLGPDALTISAAQLRNAISGSTRMIKVALLDQSVLAGVGNIYADEALHRAGIDPRMLCDRIDSDTVRTLAQAIRWILRGAVRARGSTLRDYRDVNDQEGRAQRNHLVYSRSGLPCLGCGTRVESTRIAQRTTCWCPLCQSPI
jgi:formamidopyrimidine-DNA glycosylase